MTTLYPPALRPSRSANLLHIFNKYPRISAWASLAFDNFVKPYAFVGITRKCVFATGAIALYAKQYLSS